jgi:hypothetical protein
MAGNRVTTELASVLSYDRSGMLVDSSALRASIATAIGAAESDTAKTAALAAPSSPASTTLSDAVRQNSNHLADLANVFRGQIDSIAENTRALIENTTSGRGVGSTAANVAKAAGSMIAGGLTLSPLIGGIMKLFGGGGGDPAPQPLVKYLAPASIQVDSGVAGGRLTPIDYDAAGRARPAAPVATPSPITVNVQAIDSRSFLDHSEAIAAAVRKAMLNSSALNDVVAEL